jgi:hypothetical protein
LIIGVDVDQEVDGCYLISGCYTKKVIYWGIQNIVVLHVYYSTLISIQKRNKVVQHLMQGLLIVQCLVKLSLGDWECGAGATWECGAE